MQLAQFLLWYQLISHSGTGVPPAEFLLGRRPRSKLDLLKPNLSKTAQSKIEAQKKNHDAGTKLRSFKMDDDDYVNDFLMLESGYLGKL